MAGHVFPRGKRALVVSTLVSAICWMAFLLVVAAPSPARPEDSNFTRPSLKGISAVNVVIDFRDRGARAVMGLTEEDIRTDVELKLRLAGVRVVTDQQDLQLSGRPTLYVRVKFSPDALAVIIEVRLLQDVRLERNGEQALGVETWSMGGVASNPTSIRDRIKDETDGFLNAWLSFNPKKPESTMQED